MNELAVIKKKNLLSDENSEINTRFCSCAKEKFSIRILISSLSSLTVLFALVVVSCVFGGFYLGNMLSWSYQSRIKTFENIYVRVQNEVKIPKIICNSMLSFVHHPDELFTNIDLQVEFFRNFEKNKNDISSLFLFQESGRMYLMTTRASDSNELNLIYHQENITEYVIAIACNVSCSENCVQLYNYTIDYPREYVRTKKNYYLNTQKGRSGWGESYFNHGVNISFKTIAMPIFDDESGDYLGGIAADITSEKINNLFNTHLLGDSFYYIIEIFPNSEKIFTFSGAQNIRQNIIQDADDYFIKSIRESYNIIKETFSGNIRVNCSIFLKFDKEYKVSFSISGLHPTNNKIAPSTSWDEKVKFFSISGGKIISGLGDSVSVGGSVFSVSSIIFIISIFSSFVPRTKKRK